MRPQALRASAEMNITPLIDAERQLAISQQQVLIVDLENRLRAVFDERTGRT